LTDKPFAGCTIAFDLDGTLVDSAPDLIGTLNTILAEHGHAPLPLESARDMIGRGAKALLERGFMAAGASLDEARMPGLFEQFLTVYLGRIADESRPFDGVEATLDALIEGGAILVVCTNKRTDLSVALMDALDLSRRFAAIVGADLAPAAKPDPRHLLTAVKLAGGDPTRALMVGDSASDAHAARDAQIPVVLVTFGYTEVPVRELHSDAVIDRFGDLLGEARRLFAVA
jgi:phosphoglycolate phosphatase